ncbi:hypothetical protein AYO44_18725 [Planctomycetaceae bacterium SCGC AG-212-F19]|nr:hypothetical protein AYO44_18725 [Planctomycetaceae bacterium SCGC AG-212-F19]
MAEPIHADTGRRDETRTSPPPTPGALAAHSDEDLLRWYRATGAPEALGTIVGRHYPMVFRTSLRMLANFHDAEDVAQATFLVLAQRPHLVRRLLSGWLYETARGIASNFRKVAARRRQREREAGGVNDLHAGDRELQEELDAALLRLPYTLREAVILRYLEGRSQEEAAQVAGCPQGTLARRSAEGLHRLREILERRGVFASLALILAGLNADAMIASPPPPVLQLRQRGNVVPATGPCGKAAMRPSFKALVTGAFLVFLGVGMLGVGLAEFVRYEKDQAVPELNNPAEAGAPRDIWPEQLEVAPRTVEESRPSSLAPELSDHMPPAEFQIDAPARSIKPRSDPPGRTPRDQPASTRALVGQVRAALRAASEPPTASPGSRPHSPVLEVKIMTPRGNRPCNHDGHHPAHHK